MTIGMWGSIRLGQQDYSLAPVLTLSYQVALGIGCFLIALCSSCIQGLALQTLGKQSVWTLIAGFKNSFFLIGSLLPPNQHLPDFKGGG